MFRVPSISGLFKWRQFEPEVILLAVGGWGDDSSEDARRRTEVVSRLCETLGQYGWNILCDSNVLRSGDLISGFMKRIGLADRVGKTEGRA